MPLTHEQIAFEKAWVERWLEGTRSLRPELWVDPFYQGKRACLFDNIGNLQPADSLFLFSTADATVLRGELPPLKGIDAIRDGVTEMCQLFSVFEARSVKGSGTASTARGMTLMTSQFMELTHLSALSNVSITIDEANSRLIILCDMTMCLAPDSEQKKFTTPAAIVIKKVLGANEEKMSEEQAILDRSALSQRLMELGILPTPKIEA